jgi:hypothetical protein
MSIFVFLLVISKIFFSTNVTFQTLADFPRDEIYSIAMKSVHSAHQKNPIIN